MKKIKRLLFLVLVFMLFVLPIAGCGKKESGKIDKNTVYLETELNVKFDNNYTVNRSIIKGDVLYYCGYEYDADWNYMNSFGRVGLDGSNPVRYELAISNGWVDNMQVLNNGDFLIVYSEYYSDDSDPENYIWEERFYAVEINPDGKEVKRIDLNGELGISWLNNFMLLDDGSIMMTGNMQMFVFDESLNLISKYDYDNEEYYDNFYTMRDGTFVCSMWGDKGIELYKYDATTGKKGDKLEINVSLYNYSIIGGNDQYDLLLTDSIGVSGYNIGDAEVTPIMNFINSDISTSYFSSFDTLPDGSFVGSYWDWNEETSTIKYCKYTKVDPSEIKDKTIITLGCVYQSDQIKKDVIKFNKSSNDYRIVINDYSQYSNEDDWDAGTRKFNSDIASGNAPDIIIADMGTIADYYSKGLFKDLTGFIKDDPEIDYDNIFPNLIEACSYNGKLYEITPTFYINTMVGKGSVLGNRNSWTFEEFLSFNNSLPEGMEMMKNVSRESFLDEVLSVDAAEFVDMAAAKCYFDSPEFISLLEYVKTLPEMNEDFWNTYYDYSMDESTAVRENRTAVTSTSISYIRDYGYLVNGYVGKDLVFIGYPCKNGNGSAISYGSSYAISSKCKHADIAWSIIRTYLTPEYQSNVYYGIPATISRFDELAKEATQKPYYMDGDTRIEYDDTFYVNGEEVVIDPCTDEDIAKLKDFILSVNKRVAYLSDIETIIEEEAAAFYEGQKSAEDVAKIIQSRASIYINEKQ